MIEFGGEKIGNPWHGLYRAATGKVTPPAGGDIDRSGYAPLSGDCWLIQIPGLPVPTTTPAEAAAGKTWTNYALISDGSVYGTYMGDPIYVDPAGRPWRVMISHGGNRVDKVINVTVSAKRFGLVAPGTAGTTTLSAMSVTFDTHPDYPVYDGEYSGSVLLDVAVNGRKILIGVSRHRGYSAIAEVTLTGSPADGSFASSLALLADEAGIDEWPASLFDWQASPTLRRARHWIYDWSADPKPYPGGTYPSSPTIYYADDGSLMAFDGTNYSAQRIIEDRIIDFNPTLAGFLEDGYISSTAMTPATSTWSAKWLAAARYDSSWAAVIGYSEIDWQVDYEATFPGGDAIQTVLLDGAYAPPLLFEQVDQSIVSRVVIGSITTESQQQIISATTQTAPGAYSAIYQLLISGDIVKTVTSAHVSPWYSTKHSWLRPPGDEVAGSIGLGAVRFSNSLYMPSMVKIQLGPETALGTGSTRYNVSERSYGSLSGRIGSAAFISGTGYASEHPVSGDIAQADSVVCWV